MFKKILNTLQKASGDYSEETDFLIGLMTHNWDQVLIDISKSSKLSAVWLKKRLNPELTLVQCKTYLENLIRIEE